MNAFKVLFFYGNYSDYFHKAFLFIVFSLLVYLRKRINISFTLLFYEDLFLFFTYVRYIFFKTDVIYLSTDLPRTLKWAEYNSL